MTELYEKIKSLDVNELSEDDLDDLLSFFKVVKNPSIRDWIAFIFSDVKYNRALPFILEEINKKENYTNNGSLVFALQGLNTVDHFIDILKIICEMEYEARLMAFEIIHQIRASVTDEKRIEGIKMLKDFHLSIESTEIDPGENSRLHFIECTIRLLETK